MLKWNGYLNQELKVNLLKQEGILKKQKGNSSFNLNKFYKNIHRKWIEGVDARTKYSITKLYIIKLLSSSRQFEIVDDGQPSSADCSCGMASTCLWRTWPYAKLLCQLQQTAMTSVYKLSEIRASISRIIANIVLHNFQYNNI